ncbi:MAG TPA: winged helix-turn-helix domain-containing protein [Acetobacteraceae bacterium]|nr:winged helix-turn-helix domain-containing protein [Acetobacteraceae bacterium]
MKPAPRRQAGIAFGRFQVWPDRRDLLAGREPIRLGGRTFEALKARVWPNRAVEDNNLAAQIVALRKALRPEHGLIRTVAGRGYQSTGETRFLPAATDGAPAVASVSAAKAIQAPTNLAEQVTELIGREDELADRPAGFCPTPTGQDLCAAVPDECSGRSEPLRAATALPHPLGHQP